MTVSTQLASVPYEVAKTHLLAFEGAVDDPELGAVVTHWLADMSSEPIGYPEAAGDWRQVLSVGSAQTSLLPAVTNPQAVVRVDYSGVPFPPPDPVESGFRFIDLFAGIGGFRLGLQAAGGFPAFSSEWDEAAKVTYEANFGEVPFGDIRRFTGLKVSDEQVDSLIPDHDVLAAGFPCQPFSKAGVSARESLGQTHGFEDDIQGTLFFDIARILRVKQPRVAFLENVRNLERHDGGRTFRVIRSTLESLGYRFSARVIDASSLVPQRRERVYMVGVLDGDAFEFGDWFRGAPLPLKQALEENPDDRYTISDRLWNGHRERTQRNLDRGAGFTAFEADLDKPANTLVARYGKDGKECLIPQPGSNPRMLSPRECARLQGFPEQFLIPVPKTSAYRQFGNAVAVPVVETLARHIVDQTGLVS